MQNRVKTPDANQAGEQWQKLSKNNDGKSISQAKHSRMENNTNSEVPTRVAVLGYN
jgi:predicted Zn-dependent protease